MRNLWRRNPRNNYARPWLRAKLSRAFKYAWDHYPWKFILIPCTWVALILGSILFYIPFVHVPEKGGWLALFRRERARRRQKRAWEEWTPRPLQDRSRDVRFWSAITKKTDERAMNMQKESLLFGHLPQEIQERIFEFVIEAVGPRLHIQQSYGRFGFAPCRERDGEGFPHEGMECLWDQLDHTVEEKPRSFSRLVLWDYSDLKYAPEVKKGMRDHCIKRSDNTLALALSCKLGAATFLPLLYTHSTFSFTSLSQFRTFSQTIPPTSLNRIRHLDFSIEFDVFTTRNERVDLPYYNDKNRYPGTLNPWRAGWRVIASMRGLRTLKADLRCGYRRTRGADAPFVDRAWIEDRILEPMRGVRNVRNVFFVEVNWPDPVRRAGDAVVVDLNVEEVPFELRRCGERMQRAVDWMPPVREVGLEDVRFESVPEQRGGAGLLDAYSWGRSVPCHS